MTARNGKEYGMALVCENGAKECCGCGNCRADSASLRRHCHFCGDALDGDEGYRDSVFEVLCLECLLSLHWL